MIGISTCYWTEDDMAEKASTIVNEIIEMCFEYVELEYRISSSMFKKMKPLIKKNLSVSSIHNYFPKPDDPKVKGSGDLFLLSSTDKDEHSMAIKYTIRTIEHANDMEAKAVVLHLGKVDMPNPFDGFKRLFQENKINTEEGKKFIKKQRDIRNKNKQKNLDAVLKALDKLLIQAERYGIFLGIENRFYFHEIPELTEIEMILQEFKGANIGYWHDIGHAVVQEKFGICSQKNLLNLFLNDIIGVHIHDVRGIEDHLVPGEGELNFKEIMQNIKKDIIKVFEIHKKANKKYIKNLAKTCQF